MHIPLLIWNKTPFLKISKNENKPNLTQFCSPNLVQGTDHRSSGWSGWIKVNQASNSSQIRLNQGRSSLIKVNQAIFFLSAPKTPISNLKTDTVAGRRRNCFLVFENMMESGLQWASGGMGTATRRPSLARYARLVRL